jgi:outer membrane protein with beta-barrel domain
MRLLARCVLFLTLCIAAFSQTNEDRGFTFHAGGGYTPLVGDISRSLDNGWNAQAGAGYMFTPTFGLTADYQYNGLNVPTRVITELNVPDASAWVHSATVGPEVRFAPSRRISPYVVGGVGWYRRTIEFTRPTTAVATAFDPFFGFFFPTLISTNVVLGNITRDGFGGNVGGGFNVRLRESGKAKLFAEARYHRAMHARADTEMIPFTIGIRW